MAGYGMAKVTDLDQEGLITDQGKLRSDDYVFVAIPRRKVRLEGWYMGFQQAFIELAKDKELRGEPRSVLDYLLGCMDFENFIAVEQKKIAEELGMHKVNVSKAIALLVRKGILVKGPKMGRHASYRMNLFLAWKGKASDHKTAAKKNRKGHLELV
jgi:hypothetical protein